MRAMSDPAERPVRECVARELADDRHLIGLSRRGDRRARELMVERYLPLARSLARRYRHGPEPVEDLIQVAAVGLVKAVDRWDPNRGYAFASFAVPTVLGEIRRHLRDATWAVRPPRALQELGLSIHKARDALTGELGREPTVIDLADRLQRTPDKVLAALQAAEARVPSWLDGPVPGMEGSEVTVGELIAVADEELERAEARISVERLVRLLDHRSEELVRLRFEEGLSQSQIARRTGVSQMQVSRCLRSALERLYTHGFESPPSTKAA
jgi:RNA polymerase sigma-B factor